MNPGAARRFPTHEATLVLALLGYALVPLVVAWLRRMPGVDRAWDFMMATGFVAFGLAAPLPLVVARWWAQRQRNPAFLRQLQQLHRQLSHAVLAFALVHVGGILCLEPRTLAYLALSAPDYLLAGLVALVLVGVLVLSSRERIKRRWPRASWRRWHAAMSAATLGLMAWHLLASGYWSVGLGAWVALPWLVAVPTLIAWYWRRHPPVMLPVAEATRVKTVRERRTASAAWAIALWLVLACLVFARWTATPRPSTEPYPCPAGRCL